MEVGSKLLEHTLIMGGDNVGAYSVWQGWPATFLYDLPPLEQDIGMTYTPPFCFLIFLILDSRFVIFDSRFMILNFCFSCYFYFILFFIYFLMLHLFMYSRTH